MAIYHWLGLAYLGAYQDILEEEVTKARNNTYPDTAPSPSKAQQQEENKRLMEEFEAKHGKVETDPIKPVTVQSIKEDNKRAFSGANKAGYKSPGRNRKDK